MKTNVIGTILLAAGASMRMGEPKQLLPFQGASLLRRQAQTALGASDAAVVVLGANAEIIKNEIADLPVQIAENADWQTGMSGSISCGLKTLLAGETKLEAVIITVCDQPLVDEHLLGKLVEKFRETAALIVACEYEATRGVPALFSRALFAELLALDETGGAKQIIKKYESQTAAVPFPGGAFDVDTKSDYEKLLRDFS